MDKTKYIVFRPKQKRSRVDHNIQLMIDNKNIDQVKETFFWELFWMKIYAGIHTCLILQKKLQSQLV